jgi:hypothetical protein
LFNTSGAGVQVSCEYNMIHLKFSAPPVMFVSIYLFYKTKFQLVYLNIFIFFKYETEGLLGYWNNKKDDEFRTPGGHVVPIDSSDMDINKQFGMKC